MQSCDSESDAGSGDSGQQKQPVLWEIDDQVMTKFCTRCYKIVYATEKIEVGILLHRNCFRCRECNMVLSLHNFVLAKAEETGDKQPDVWCRSHAPKHVKNNMDTEAWGIKNAVHSQRLQKTTKFSSQIRLNDTSGWEYDPKAMEFELAKALHDRNRMRRPLHHDAQADNLDYTPGELLERMRRGDMPRNHVRDLADNLGSRLNLGSLAESASSADYMAPGSLTGVPGSLTGAPPLAPPDAGVYDRATDYIYSHPGPVPPQLPPNMPSRDSREQIYESLMFNRPTSPPVMNVMGRHDYYDKALHSGAVHDQRATEYAAAARLRDGRRRGGYEHVSLGPPPPNAVAGPPLRTAHVPQHMRENKTFMAQNALELRQRHEHGLMWRELERQRAEQIRELEDDIRRQMERAMNDLFRTLDTDHESYEGSMHYEKLAIEQRFLQMKNERMEQLMLQLTEHERRRLDDVIDRQTQEMLALIDQKMPTKLPPPRPPLTRKHELFAGPNVFDDVDFTAVQVAQSEQASFTELVYELTKGCRTTLEKTRAVFRWITAKDLNQIIFREEVSEDSPYFFLRGIKYGLESYHELFKMLCSYAGIPVRIIRGVSKSAGYRPGAQLTSQYRNSWAVVLIDGDWRFVDSHWGARHVTNPGRGDQPSEFCYAVDEFFFLTDPEQHALMHLPDEWEWQLLEPPMSMEEFVDRPLVKSHFLHYGLRLPPEVGAVIETDTGKVEFVLARGAVPLAFRARLELDDVTLEGYVIHHFGNNEVIFNISLPSKGIFYLTLFACDTDKSDAYNNVCAFRLRCKRVDVKPFCKFPKLPDGYGPTALATQLGMRTEKYNEYYLVCNDEKLIMNIKFKSQVKLSHKLLSGDSNQGYDLDRMVFERFRDKTSVSYLIRLPARGIYVFSIFAGSRAADSQMLECACRYLIQCNSSPSGLIRPYPRAQSHWLRARLHEPTTGDLRLNKNVKFKLEVQEADAVAVIINNQWFYLKKTGKVWEGVAFTGKDGAAAAEVYARYGADTRDFYPLLEYKLSKDNFIDPCMEIK